MLRENTVSIADSSKMTMQANATISKSTHSNVLNARDLNIEVPSNKRKFITFSFYSLPVHFDC